MQEFLLPHKGVSNVSKPVNGVSERSKCSEVERCEVSERSEWWERMNVASDLVAR